MFTNLLNTEMDKRWVMSIEEESAVPKKFSPEMAEAKKN